MTHDAFHSPYVGPLSLLPFAEHDVSLTATLFFAARLEQNTVFVFNPEIAGGRGFSEVNGLANQPNGELPRVGQASPTPYIARLSSSTISASERKRSMSIATRILSPGTGPLTRYSIYAGRFTVTDYFDNNAYTHDPRTQFMAWSVMYNALPRNPRAA